MRVEAVVEVVVMRAVGGVDVAVVVRGWTWREVKAAMSRGGAKCDETAMSRLMVGYHDEASIW